MHRYGLFPAYHQKTYDLSHNDDTNNKNTETETLLTNIQSLFDKLNAN